MSSGSIHTVFSRTLCALESKSAATVICFLICGTLFAGVTQTSQRSSGVWVTTESGLYYIDPDANAIARGVALADEARALAADPLRGGAWLLSERTLRRYDQDLAPAEQVELRNLSVEIEDPASILCDPNDSGMWIAVGKNLIHLDPTGQQIAAAGYHEKIRDAVLDLDGSVWVLAGRRLLQVSAYGVALSSISVEALRSPPRSLALDRLGNRIWVTDGKRVLRFDPTNPAAPPLALETSVATTGGTPDGDSGISTLAVHPVFGTLWFASRRTLRIYDRQGQLLRQVDLTPLELGEIQRIVFDPADLALWLGGERALGRFRSNGDLVARIPVPDEPRDMAASPFRLVPTLSLIAPMDNALTNNASMSLRYRPGAECSGTPCIFDPDYTRTLRFDADLNGQPIGSSFIQTPEEAVYSPGTRLPEGGNTASVIAIDRYGRMSDRLTHRFTVDTIPPHFMSLTPVDGSTVDGASARIEGRVDDPTATVQLMDGSGNMIGIGGGQFVFVIELATGWNSYLLVAHDSAGNSAGTSVRLYRSGMDAAITSIVSDATVDTDSLSLSGTYAGAENTGITVNGVVALTDGQNFYVNNLPLAEGLNTLTLTMSGPDGQVITKTLTVTSSGRAPFHPSVEPQSGIAPLKVRFSGRLRDGSSVTNLALDADGDGTMDVSSVDNGASIEFSYDTPGLYRPKLAVVDSKGRSYEQVLAVHVRDPGEADGFFTRLWSGMNDSLRRGDVNGALIYLNASAKSKYQPVFEALLSQMPSIIASYSPPARLSVTESIGEYAISRPYQGETRVYLVYFLQDADGVWRLDEM